MLSLHNGALKPNDIYAIWHNKYNKCNYGAFVVFAGIVRDENSIFGLSFDVYEPILQKWFEVWQNIANKKSALILMAHSIGNVMLNESSFMCAVLSPKRRVALELLDQFVEDFKARAPIWKYDITKDGRIYANDRSTKLQGFGILA